jgi:hypothetical protein
MSGRNVGGGVDRQANLAVSENLLDGVHVHALAEQEGCTVVPQVRAPVYVDHENRTMSITDSGGCRSRNRTMSASFGGGPDLAIDMVRILAGAP